MKFRLFGLFVLLCSLVVILCNQPNPTRSQTANATLSQSEQDLLSEINKARAQPEVYAGYLEKLKPLFKGKVYTPEGMAAGLETQEGWDAVEDAIKFLKATKPVPPLNGSEGLRLAAVSHVKEQSASGATGHAGADKMLIEERVKSYGAWQGDIGENLSYGNESARERLLTWLIDDGVKSRGHRRRVMSQDYKVAGPLCDSGDVYFDIEREGRLPDYRRLPAQVEPGEVVALLNSGAYSLAQMFPYNGRPLPAAVMVREGGNAELIRRRDTYDDLLANDVW